MTAWLCSWQRLAPANGKLLIYIHGSSSAAADQLIGSVAEQSGMALLTVDAQLLQDSEAGVESTLFLVFREALLSQSAVYLRNMDGVLERTQGAAHYRTLMRCLADMGVGRATVELAVAGRTDRLASMRVAARRIRRATAGLAATESR
jgi:hypothetical protein